jgi:hypothetical protein
VQDAIDFALVQELRVFRLDRFQFDGHFFASGHVGSQIDITKGPTADLPTETVLFAHPKLHDEFNVSPTAANRNDQTTSNPANAECRAVPRSPAVRYDKSATTNKSSAVAGESLTPIQKPKRARFFGLDRAGPTQSKNNYRTDVNASWPVLLGSL